MYRVKISDNLINDSRVQSLSFELRWLYIELFISSAPTGGVLPSVGELQSKFQQSGDAMMQSLIALRDVGLLDLRDGAFVVVDFEQEQSPDDTATRVRRYREKRKKSVTKRYTEGDECNETLQECNETLQVGGQNCNETLHECNETLQVSAEKCNETLQSGLECNETLHPEAQNCNETLQSGAENDENLAKSPLVGGGEGGGVKTLVNPRALNNNNNLNPLDDLNSSFGGGVGGGYFQPLNFEKCNETLQVGEANSVAYRAYEHEIGPLTPAIVSSIDIALEKHPLEWVTEAIRLAAVYNKRSWRYVAGILRRWSVDGFQPIDSQKPGGNGKQPLTKASKIRQNNIEVVQSFLAEEDDR